MHNKDMYLSEQRASVMGSKLDRPITSAAGEVDAIAIAHGRWVLSSWPWGVGVNLLRPGPGPTFTVNRLPRDKSFLLKGGEMRNAIIYLICNGSRRAASLKITVPAFALHTALSPGGMGIVSVPIHLPPD